MLLAYIACAVRIVARLTRTALCAARTETCASTSEDCGDCCAVAGGGGGPPVAVSGATGVVAETTSAAATSDARIARWSPADDPADDGEMAEMLTVGPSARPCVDLRGSATFLVVRLVALLALVGCAGGGPSTPEALVALLQQEGGVRCTAVTQAGPAATRCASPDGDLIGVVTDDPAGVIRRTRVEFGGPWIATDRWVVVSDRGDLDRLRGIRDRLGVGALYLDVDEVPVEVD